MARGNVKWFNTVKGIGLISSETGAKDVFLHISALERAGILEVYEGQSVIFDIEIGRSGREVATNLILG